MTRRITSSMKLENSEDFDNWSQQSIHESRKDQFENAPYYDCVTIKSNFAFNVMANTNAYSSVKKLYFDTYSCALSQDMCK